MNLGKSDLFSGLQLVKITGYPIIDLILMAYYSASTGVAFLCYYKGIMI